MDVEAFWRLTPKETFAAIDAAAWRQDVDHRRNAWLAWHVAALSRAKRLPSLKRLVEPKDAKPLHGEELERRRQERDDMLQSIDMEKLNRVMQERRRGGRE